MEFREIMLATGTSFKETAYSSSSIGHMMKERFQEAGVYRGQSTHGSRRGKMQHEHHELGRSLELVMQRSHIKTAAVGKLYVDRHAHLPFQSK